MHEVGADSVVLLLDAWRLKCGESATGSVEVQFTGIYFNLLG